MVRSLTWVCSLVVDHLVNNAGVANVCWFEEVPDVSDLKQVLVRFIAADALLYSLISVNEGSRCLN